MVLASGKRDSGVLTGVIRSVDVAPSFCIQGTVLGGHVGLGIVFLAHKPPWG